MVQTFEFQYFFAFQTNEYFWGYEDFVDIFGVITKLDYIKGVISMHFMVFSEGQCTEWGYFWGV